MSSHLFQNRPTRTPAQADRGSKSRSNAVTSERLASLPTHLDHAIRCESQTRAPPPTDRGSMSRSNAVTSERLASLPTHFDHAIRCESQTRARVLGGRLRVSPALLARCRFAS